MQTQVIRADQQVCQAISYAIFDRRLVFADPSFPQTLLMDRPLYVVTA